MPEDKAQERVLFIRKLALVVFVAIAYYFAGKFGLSLASVNPSASAVWPPAGMALAAFLLLGIYIWPAIFVGAFLVNLSTTGLAIPSLTIAMGNTIEALVGAYLVTRFANGSNAFARAQDVIKFALLAGFVGTAISATVGATSLIGSGLAVQSDFAAIWVTWLLGDATGILIVGPLIILWVTGPKRVWTTSRLAEAGLMLMSAVLVAAAVFANGSFIGAGHYPLEFVIAPWIVWAAFRFGRRETAAIIVVFAAVALAGALRGFGPFARALPNESLLLLQGFMGTVAITGLILATLVLERTVIETELRRSYNGLRLSADELRLHNSKMILLNEMGDLLQSCSRVDEAYSVIGQFGERLFREEAGALYMIDNTQSLVETAVVWGRQPPEQDSFALDECWALRRGRAHLMHENGLELPCPHLNGRPLRAALCIPLSAQGETMGILHLESGFNSEDRSHVNITETQLQLAKAMADTVALALANLKLRMSLLHQSIRDPLTDLFNRRYLEETLEREIRRAARLQRSVGVMMLDIDRFKWFNDTFSHEAGDTLLHELGSFLKQQIRGGDFACRYGGEEFVLIMPEISLDDIRSGAERLRENVRDLRVEYAGGDLETITLSLGVALFPLHGANGRALLHAADEALYEAKQQGRDRVVMALTAPQGPLT